LYKILELKRQYKKTEETQFVSTGMNMLKFYNDGKFRNVYITRL